MANQAYKIVNYGKKSVRRNYSKIRTDVDLPNLVEIQTRSFEKFVNNDLKELFDDLSPIVSHDGKLSLSFGEYHFEPETRDIVECKLRDVNYSRPLKVKVSLEKDNGEISENEIFMGDIPFMTPAGTFIINGAERVVVSQIIRSSGVYYSREVDKKTSQVKYIGQMIPTRGAWINLETGSRDVWYCELDRSKKIYMSTVLRAFGFETNEEMVDFFGEYPNFEATFQKDQSLTVDDALLQVYEKFRVGDDNVMPANAKKAIQDRFFRPRRYDLQTVGRYKFNLKLDVLSRARGHVLANDIVYLEDFYSDETGELLYSSGHVVLKKGSLLDNNNIELLSKHRGALRKLVDLKQSIYDKEEFGETYVECLSVYNPHDEHDIVKIVGSDNREDKLFVTFSDMLAAFSYYFNLYKGIGYLDDIDNLGNRRLRLIGELIKNQFRLGFAKLEKNVKDRMATVEYDECTPDNLINIRPLTSSLKEFFGSSQLSQFMDQMNPLAEITQKRRISALGTGGIQRDRASVEVRDVHNSHYGRMCPIETPEGPSIGLITSLATYATVNEYGFIETPYFVVKTLEDGRKQVTDEIVRLSADQEEGVAIASAVTKLDDDNCIIEENVIARRSGETEIVPRSDLSYMDVSPKQIVSVAAACVPFLENDDATRALMGANMQRQAVPIINPEAPIVGTGMEYRAAKDSGSAIIALKSGVCSYVDCKKIVVENDDQTVSTYTLYQYLRSNSSTAILHRPIVEVGERVDQGDIIADGQSMKNGELALGRNVRVAFMTWDGYNYEDAVIMSERMVYDDVYTSIHIDEHSVETCDTKSGREEFTRELTSVNEELLKHLDPNGIILPGTEVKEGDILVGKISPKGISEPTAEERLLQSIFGEKSKDSKDTSLRVPHGGGGIVQSIQHYKKENGDDLPVGVNEVVRVYIAQKRKITVGDKMAGRHGNKGVISNILPIEDMPFNKDGEPIDIMLNPQGVPSRMNIGQVLELHLGMAAKKLGVQIATPVFDGASIEDIENIIKEAGLPEDGKEILYDGRSGEPFDNPINVGIMYFIKLSHMVDDKLHARSIGPYTLVTQQPMGGKAQNGGQRFGEMEVWALEAYGASHTLQEMLTIKSDDIVGRNHVYNAISSKKPIPEPSIPESFRVLIKELQALAIDVELINQNGENEVNKSLVDIEKKFA